MQTPKVRRWKGDMRLNGRGKDGSRLLALQLFPQAAHLLKCDPLPPCAQPSVSPSAMGSDLTLGVVSCHQFSSMPSDRDP